MTISIDSNVIASLWAKSNLLNIRAATMLHRARRLGNLVISGAVYAELRGDPARSEEELEEFLHSTGIAIDWNIGEADWREAGKAYHGFVRRRRKSGAVPPRRILADFLIGAHSLVRDYTLLTTDGGHYRSAFPNLKIMSE
jgi:predicted nucleic acid-binding protein